MNRNKHSSAARKQDKLCTQWELPPEYVLANLSTYYMRVLSKEHFAASVFVLPEKNTPEKNTEEGTLCMEYQGITYQLQFLTNPVRMMSDTRAHIGVSFRVSRRTDRAIALVKSWYPKELEIAEITHYESE